MVEPVPAVRYTKGEECVAIKDDTCTFHSNVSTRMVCTFHLLMSTFATRSLALVGTRRATTTGHTGAVTTMMVAGNGNAPQTVTGCEKALEEGGMHMRERDLEAEAAAEAGAEAAAALQKAPTMESNTAVATNQNVITGKAGRADQIGITLVTRVDIVKTMFLVTGAIGLGTLGVAASLRQTETILEASIGAGRLSNGIWLKELLSRAFLAFVTTLFRYAKRYVL